MNASSALKYNLTRIAPTPSGFLHLGNVYNFALTARLARKHNADILLRIDDMDQDRVNIAYLQDIFDTLSFLDIPFNRGPKDVRELYANFSQTNRMVIYEQMLHQLLETGRIFACNCSRSKILKRSPTGTYPGTCRDKKIDPGTPGVAWRLRTSHHTAIIVKAPDGYNAFFLPESQRDLVVRKKDGFPSYQLTSLADDLHFGTDLIVRGKDLWDSTLAQLYIASLIKAKPFADVTFVHHDLLTHADGTKLSKSAGATSIQHLRKEGKSASDIYRLLGTLTGQSGQLNSWQDLSV
ncbi:glutamate--tRNA ligase family protein [Pedobacter sp. SYP-B3415]|uniref:glutamate--tRNA ligase family protein n=1 Tax=Pedobacter sp. SYP-B3415 TaxID=2496641 RepID=UPI00101DDE21|nr:glutamate--tRNA ligase family protein [Pedobacter sp. SYP-B3415]